MNMKKWIRDCLMFLIVYVLFYLTFRYVILNNTEDKDIANSLSYGFSFTVAIIFDVYRGISELIIEKFNKLNKENDSI